MGYQSSELSRGPQLHSSAGHIMDNIGREIEAKFIVENLDEVRQRLLALGGQLIIPCHLEINHRFDTHDSRLRTNDEVLRLRQGPQVTLTYKRSTSAEERIEFELEIDDFHAAQSLLEALGYHLIFTYEKYREVYTLDEAKVMLDELPFSLFTEVEGPSLEAIKQKVEILGLDWIKRVKYSYLDLFDILHQRLNLPFENADFDSFQEWPSIHPSDLGLDDAVQSFSDSKSERTEEATLKE
ncbi:MAG TPA: class IV adenylate cyclase [Anaerolineae bacterium]|nr:class IV adenylate cyclase [Anaerolineae bacterium]